LAVVERLKVGRIDGGIPCVTLIDAGAAGLVDTLVEIKHGIMRVGAVCRKRRRYPGVVGDIADGASQPVRHGENAADVSRRGFYPVCCVGMRGCRAEKQDCACDRCAECIGFLR